jgi:N-acetylmuramoyl-L-alanine amidase
LRAAEAARLPDLDIAKGPVRTDVRGILEDLDRSARIRDSSELAKILYREWQDSNASKPTRASRGIRQAPFFLVSNIAMPSVLVEVGFLSNAKEGARLQQPDYQAALAEALASGISRYMKRTEL